jgi:hypothetical protein
MSLLDANHSKIIILRNRQVTQYFHLSTIGDRVAAEGDGW